MVFAVYKFTPC